jgi:hypothetical protein
MVIAELSIQQTRIQLPKDEWFAPLTRTEIDWAAKDPAYGGFLKVARFVGAWASIFPAETRGKYLLDVPAVVYVPLADSLPGETAGEAKAIGERDGQVITFDFSARLTGIVDGFAAYAVTVNCDREYA